MTTIGPAAPGETDEEYIRRVVATAARPRPDQLARLAALLRSGRTPPDVRDTRVADAVGAEGGDDG